MSVQIYLHRGSWEGLVERLVSCRQVHDHQGPAGNVTSSKFEMCGVAEYNVDGAFVSRLCQQREELIFLRRQCNRPDLQGSYFQKEAIPGLFWKAAALRAITGVYGLYAMLFPFLELMEEAAYEWMMLGDARQLGKCTSAASC
jgi:hypothetical protein